MISCFEWKCTQVYIAIEVDYTVCEGITLCFEVEDFFYPDYIFSGSHVCKTVNLIQNSKLDIKVKIFSSAKYIAF